MFKLMFSLMSLLVSIAVQIAMWVVISVLASLVLQFLMHGTKPSLEIATPKFIVRWYYRLIGQYRKSESI